LLQFQDRQLGQLVNTDLIDLGDWYRFTHTISKSAAILIYYHDEQMCRHCCVRPSLPCECQSPIEHIVLQILPLDSYRRRVGRVDERPSKLRMACRIPEGSTARLIAMIETDVIIRLGQEYRLWKSLLLRTSDLPPGHVKLRLGEWQARRPNPSLSMSSRSSQRRDYLKMSTNTTHVDQTSRNA
jgi:hypothetical protein